MEYIEFMLRRKLGFVTEGFFQPKPGGRQIRPTIRILNGLKEKLLACKPLDDEEWRIVNTMMNGYVKFPDATTLKSFAQRAVQAYQDYPGAQLNFIDVSAFEDLSELFRSYDGDRYSFNMDISRWDVSHVTNMRGMFTWCVRFNQDLSGWDVSKVTDMSDMFRYCYGFDQNLQAWDVSSVTNMADMFQGCRKLSNPDIGGWDVSSVTDMHHMFGGCFDFNCDLSGWNVSRVSSMYAMFYNCHLFDCDLSGWDVSSVTNMRIMFGGCENFSCDLSGWDVSRVETYSEIFDYTSQYGRCWIPEGFQPKFKYIQ